MVTVTHLYHSEAIMETSDPPLLQPAHTSMVIPLPALFTAGLNICTRL